MLYSQSVLTSRYAAGLKHTRSKHIIPVNDLQRHAMSLYILLPEPAEGEALCPMEHSTTSQEEVRSENDEDDPSPRPSVRDAEQRDGKRRLAPASCQDEEEACKDRDQTSGTDELGLDCAEVFAEPKVDIDALHDARRNERDLGDNALLASGCFGRQGKGAAYPGRDEDVVVVPERPAALDFRPDAEAEKASGCTRQRPDAQVEQRAKIWPFAIGLVRCGFHL